MLQPILAASVNTSIEFLEGHPEQENTAWGDNPSQSLWIPKWRPTPLNQLMEGHWSNGARKKKADRWVVLTYVKKEKLKPAFCKRRLYVEIVLGPRQKKADPDAYFKSLCDALVHAKMLTDDNDAGVELAPVQYSRDAQNWGTLIVLEDMR